MTGLEAFKIVYNNFDYLISDVGIENDDVNVCLKTIKEQLPTIKQALIKVEKEHKALEIIKEKRVNVGTFIHLTKILKKDYEQCKALNNTFGANICDTEKEFLTEEEFDLLKEVVG